MRSGPRDAQKASWAADCAAIFRLVIHAAEVKLRSADIEPSSDDLYAMFRLMVLNFACSVHRYPQSRAFILNAVGRGGNASQADFLEWKPRSGQVVRVHFTGPDGDYVSEMTLGVDIPIDDYKRAADAVLPWNVVSRA